MYTYIYTYIVFFFFTKATHPILSTVPLFIHYSVFALNKHSHPLPPFFNFNANLREM